MLQHMVQCLATPALHEREVWRDEIRHEKHWRCVRGQLYCVHCSAPHSSNGCERLTDDANTTAARSSAPGYVTSRWMQSASMIASSHFASVPAVRGCAVGPPPTLLLMGASQHSSVPASARSLCRARKGRTCRPKSLPAMLRLQSVAQ